MKGREAWGKCRSQPTYEIETAIIPPLTPLATRSQPTYEELKQQGRVQGNMAPL